MKKRTEFTLKDRLSAKEELANAGFVEYQIPGAATGAADLLRYNPDGSLDYIVLSNSTLLFEHFVKDEDQTRSIDYSEGANLTEFVEQEITQPLPASV